MRVQGAYITCSYLQQAFHVCEGEDKNFTTYSGHSVPCQLMLAWCKEGTVSQVLSY